MTVKVIHQLLTKLSLFNSVNFYKYQYNISAKISCNCSSFNAKKMDDIALPLMSKQLAPPLTNTKYKGQAGKIGIVGGSMEYTGAPYFAGISSLKVGADLVSVFCPKEAGMAIKSYSPELMVHPILNDAESLAKIEAAFDRLSVIVIGPGMGREKNTQEIFEKIIQICRRKEKGIILDADALFFVAQNLDIIKDYPSPGVILTPNAMELARILGNDRPSSNDTESVSNLFHVLGKTVTILCKGAEDKIIDYERTVKISDGGSGRRCGGQGDLLSGSLATFFTWALQHKIDVDVPHDDRAILACYAACKLTRECNARAFKKFGRSMTTTDMINEIHSVFEDYFELK